MRRDLREQVWQEETRQQRRSVRFSLGLMLAGAGVALLLIRGAVPQFGWPASLTSLVELVGAALVLGGVVLAAWAVWKL